MRSKNYYSVDACYSINRFTFERFLKRVKINYTYNLSLNVAAMATIFTITTTTTTR
jgi:hypothetical protein